MQDRKMQDLKMRDQKTRTGNVDNAADDEDFHRLVGHV